MTALQAGSIKHDIDAEYKMAGGKRRRDAASLFQVFVEVCLHTPLMEICADRRCRVCTSKNRHMRYFLDLALSDFPHKSRALRVEGVAVIDIVCQHCPDTSNHAA